MPSKKVTCIRVLFVLLLSLVLSQCSSAPPDVLAPDMVLYNGNIVTVDEDFSIAEAVAIKNGHFIAVGSNSEILSLAGAATETFGPGRENRFAGTSRFSCPPGPASG